MSDNPSVPWLLQPIAADDVAGFLHQRIKLSLGGDGVAVDAPGDAANGLDVDVTRVGGVVTITFNGVAQPVSVSGTPNVAIPGVVITDPAAVASEATTLVAIDAATHSIAANTNRRLLSIFNDTQRSMLIKVGAGVAANSFKLRLGGQKLWEMERPVRTSQVTFMWEGYTAGDAQGAMVTEG